MYLYLGYFVVQAYFLIEKLITSQMSFVAIVFSLVVFLVWSLIPFVGYIISTFIWPHGYLSKLHLFILGISGALIEHALYSFELIHYSQVYLGTLVTFLLFFSVGFISIGNNKVQHNEKHA